MRLFKKRYRVLEAMSNRCGMRFYPQRKKLFGWVHCTNGSTEQLSYDVIKDAKAWVECKMNPITHELIEGKWNEKH